MVEFDLVISGGQVATDAETFYADIGIIDGKIAAVASRLSGGTKRIDAGGRLVVPGGIEGHCHIAQETSNGTMPADDYYSGSVSAAFGGNSCFIPFAGQLRGQSIEQVIEVYDGRSAPNSVIDYSYHLIVSDPTPEVLERGLPQAFARGITSFKVFMTYDRVKLDDLQMLEIMSVAKMHGAITMVHAENHGMVQWMNARLAGKGRTAPRYHALSRPELAEEEAINRAIALSKLVNAPLFIVHVSTAGGANIVAREALAGARVFAETCPQYLSLTRDDLDRPGMEGAKYVCSPPVRDKQTQEALWEHIKRGTFVSVSSDHAPSRFDASGKLEHGMDAPYPKIQSGMPGLATRLPYLFSEGVVKGRIDLQQFVALSSSNAARTFGLKHKGHIAPGFDADICIWNPERSREVRLDDQHDNMDYTPLEGRTLTGVPECLISRGEVVVTDDKLVATRGRGRFVHRAPVDLSLKPGHVAKEFDRSQNFDTDIYS